jgi:hypothetical protein
VDGDGFEPGSADERVALFALGCLLRAVAKSQRNLVLRVLFLRLTELFDPKSNEPRKLTLSKKPYASSDARAWAIAVNMATRIARDGPESHEGAVCDGMKSYDVDRSTVERAWKKYKDEAMKTVYIPASAERVVAVSKDCPDLRLQKFAGDLRPQF